jgi:hypothetical protein
VPTTLTLALFLALGALSPATAHALDIQLEQVTSGDVRPNGLTPEHDDDAGLPKSQSYALKSSTAQPVPFEWFASSLSEGGNLEVGVDLERPACCITGESEAVSELRILLSNNGTEPEDFGVSFRIAPGEVIFRLPPGEQPALDQDRAYIEAAFRLSGSGIPLFLYRLELYTTNGGVEVDTAGTTNNVNYDLAYNGAGGEWGWTTEGLDGLVEVRAIQPGQEYTLTYSMRAWGMNRYRSGELGAGFSAKIGDPLDLMAGGSITFVPEPAPLTSLGAALAVLFAARRS